MTTIRGRGRGGGGLGVGAGAGGGQGGRGGGPGGGVDSGSPRRGAWRGGPPGSNGTSRVNSPVITGPIGGQGHGQNGPRQSINDHMNDLRKVDNGSGKGFRTDTDISGSTSIAERELKPWVADGPDASSALTTANGNVPRNNGAGRDSETFGAAPTGAWDQFEANARLFGTKTSWAEEIYTTKLNRSGPDYKKKEKEADRLASEIMGQTASNPHIAEERNQMESGESKDEEEKYSGVVRNPNAYVPPGARKGPVRRPSGAGPGPSPIVPTGPALTAGLPKTNGRVASPAPPTASTAPAAPSTQTAPTAAAIPIDPSGAAPKAEATAPSTSVPSESTVLPPKSTLAPSVQPPRSASNGEETSVAPVSIPSQQEKGSDGLAAPAIAMAKSDSKDGRSVVDSFRQFVGTERERVEAKKQSIAKTERERQLADLKKFQASFKVPLPMPKDILPILSKDEAKQKAMEAKAAETLKAAENAKKVQASPKTPSKPAQSKASPPKKVPMKVQEIPPFNALKRKPPALPVPETASQNIPLATSPSPSDASNSTAAAKANLNPNASSFVFKPNPRAAAFKPGQASTSTSSPVAAPPAVAGPSTYKNPFFREPPRRIVVNPREDFHPWKHAQVPHASSIPPQWPYTGRKYLVGFAIPLHQGGFVDEDGTSPHGAPPQLMPGMPPNFPQYGYRFNQPGMPPQSIPGNMGTNPMFSPGPGYGQIPGQHLQPMGGGPQPNGMPMYFQNGMPQNPHFIPPQHMQYNPTSPQYNPSTPQRPGQASHGGPGQQGPGPGQVNGPGGPGGPMFYSPNSISTPQQTPQMQHNLPFPPSHGPGQFSPMPMQGQLQAPGQGPQAAG